jgi:hypothetical protein
LGQGLDPDGVWATRGEGAQPRFDPSVARRAGRGRHRVSTAFGLVLTFLLIMLASNYTQAYGWD